MIPRYTRPEMAAIWSPETRFRIWFEIEAHAADAMAELGIIPKEAAKTIWAKGKSATFDIARIEEIERETKHDVVAFLTHLGGNRRAGSALRAPGHDLLGRARHLPQCAARARRRSSHRRRGEAQRRARAPRARVQIHADDRPLARHPRRADDLRAQACLCLCRVRPRQSAPESGARRGRDLRDLRRGRHLRASRSAGRSACGESDGAVGRADLHAGHPARPPCHVFRHARRRRRLGRAAGDRNPPPAAHRSAGGGGVFLGRAERLLGHAAQAQSGAVGESGRACAHGARLCDAGDGGRRALARARHLAFLGRAHDRARRDGDARFRAGPARRHHRQADRLSRQHAQKPRPRSAASFTRSACCSR